MDEEYQTQTSPPPVQNEPIFGSVNQWSTTKKIGVAVVLFILLLLIIRTRNSNFTVSRMPSFSLNRFRDNFKMKRDCKCKK